MTLSGRVSTALTTSPESITLREAEPVTIPVAEVQRKDAEKPRSLAFTDEISPLLV